MGIKRANLVLEIAIDNERVGEENWKGIVEKWKGRRNETGAKKEIKYSQPSYNAVDSYRVMWKPRYKKL